MKQLEIIEQEKKTDNIDIQIDIVGSNIEIFSIHPILQVKLIDCCGKIIYEGARLNRNKFRLKNEIFNLISLPMFIAIRFANRVVYNKFIP